MKITQKGTAREERKKNRGFKKRKASPLGSTYYLYTRAKRGEAKMAFGIGRQSFSIAEFLESTTEGLEPP